MNVRNFVITGFNSILYVKDKKGQTVHFEDRYASCFIVTKSGRIRFTSSKGSVISEKGRPVFIPEGLSYVNACESDAESYVFNFHISESTDEMCTLSDVSVNAVQSAYDGISMALVSPSLKSGASVFKELYGLAEMLFAESSEMSPPEKIVSDAVGYMAENFHHSSLNIKTVAEQCFVSEIYLRKLFSRYKKTTPFKVLTDIRMNRARALAMEKRPVKEIALSVGYSDIYQFSRAYKKYFGYSPSVL